MFEFFFKIYFVLLTSLVNASNNTKCVSLSNRIVARLHVLLLIYILMDTLQDNVTIHLLLIQINVSEVVILLMTYLVKYALQTKQKI